MGMSERLDQEVQNADAALETGTDDRSEDRLGASADPSAVAAPHFTVDYSGPDGLFSLIVCGIHARVPEVSQDIFQVSRHKLCQATIAPMCEPSPHQPIELHH